LDRNPASFVLDLAGISALLGTLDRGVTA
jgi:hypothetical protein